MIPLSSPRFPEGTAHSTFEHDPLGRRHSLLVEGLLEPWCHRWCQCMRFWPAHDGAGDA